MKLQFPFVQLPLAFDAAALASEIAALGEAPWKPHPQGFPGNSMLPLVAVDGDPDNEAFAGAMRVTAHLHACPYLTQVIASFGATVGRTRLMRLAGQAEVTRHADQGYYWVDRVRVHVPIVTQPTVRFECGDAAVNMAAGECWIFDTWRQHRVLNDAAQSRIHLVCDTVGGGAFWEMVARGRPYPEPAATSRRMATWHAMQVAPVQTRAIFACETVNVPAVMSPWELGTHLGFLLGEMVPHPRGRDIEQLCSQLLRAWKGLWAHEGDLESARSQYRALFDGFVAALREPAQGVMLRNQLGLLPVLQAMLGRAVVAFPVAATTDAGAQRAMGDNA